VLVVVGPLTCTWLIAAGRRAATVDRVRELGRRSRWRVPERLRSRMQAALVDADLEWSPEEVLECWLAAAVAAALVAVALSPVFALPAVLAVLAAGPATLHLARSRRERAFAAGLPGALEQVAAELRGGATVTSAVEHLAAASGPVATDLRRVHTRTELGLSLPDALASWPVDHDAPGVHTVAGALAVAATMGGRSADALEGLASSFRHRLDAVAEARSLSAQARLSAVVVGAAPLGYLFFSALVDPGAVTALVDTGVGRACLILGLGLEALAALWIRRILRSAG
jgi:tight adherence protein B